MLRSIYAGNVSARSSADVEGLNSQPDADTEDFVGEDLTRNNVCEILLLANLFRYSSVEEECLHFVKGNVKSVMSSDGWNAIANRASLLGDIMNRIIRKK